MEIRENIERVRENIASAAARAGRRVEDITLVGVTKTVDIPRIYEALDCGITEIGENKAQELTAKFDDLNGRCGIHFIGHLQTNKVKAVIDKADIIESVDSLRLAEAIDAAAAASGKRARILVEVNIGREPQKHGLLVEQLDDFFEKAVDLKNTEIRGLMTVLPMYCETQTQRRALFERMYKLFIDIGCKKKDNIFIDVLSMGMSGDYIDAVEEGANTVRIGSGIFGPREYL